ncbi:hypothetical protein ACGFZP_12730 [Kitasatospora sp. NPDC048239]
MLKSIMLSGMTLDLVMLESKTIGGFRIARRGRDENGRVCPACALE